MPKFTVDKSLFDPVEVDIGGKVYTVVPLSTRLIRIMDDLDKQEKEKKIDGLEHVTRQAAAFFGTPVDEIESIDVRALTPAIEFVTEQVNAWARAKIPAAAGTDPAGEALKN